MPIGSPSLPPRHAGPTALRAAALDARLVAFVLLGPAAVMLWIWMPTGMTLELRRRLRGRNLTRTALALLVFLEVLPSVLPYDHLLPRGHAEAIVDAAVHASHCHVRPGACSDAPVTSGPGQPLTSDPLVIVPSMLTILVLLFMPVFGGISRRPEIRPPLTVSPQ